MARPFEWMLARQDTKSGVSVPKLTSMCHPASPGSTADGNRTRKVPIAVGRSQRPGPTNRWNAACSRGVFAASTNGACVNMPSRMTGCVQVAGSSGLHPVAF